MVETSDEWIVERTGIRERRIAGADETVATLSHQAALRALDAAGLTAADLDMIVLATTSAENAFPTAACELQGLLGCKGSRLLMWPPPAPALPTRSPSPISSSNPVLPATSWWSGPMCCHACAIRKIAALSSSLVTGQGPW